MMRKLISWLSFMMVFCLLLLSCVHDEIYTASDPASKEYHSKSVFREDEKYIKNVMEIYLEYEAEIKKGNAVPLWDYAMTMGNFNESFLIVPLAEGGKVTACLQVPRNGDYVTFLKDCDPEHIKFFQRYITSKERKAVKSEPYSSAESKGMAECKISAVSMWYPADEYGSNAGHWETNYIVTCPPESTDGDGNEGGEQPTYPYPGGGGSTSPQNPKNPCEKMKTQLSPSFKSKVDDLKSKLGLKKETGYIENDNGVFTYKDNAAATENANQLSLPNPDLYKDIKGFLHTHPNDFEDSDGNIRKGFKIFSPADVIYFNELVRNAKENGLPLDDVYGVMVSGTGIYQIRFTGNVNQIKTTYVNTGEEYNDMYKKYFLANPKTSDELNFLKFMDEQMYVKGVSLVKMNDNGTFTTKTLNADKTDVSNSDCPQ